MTVAPAWGLAYVVPEDAIAAWGARLIVTQDGYEVDMLPDRQGGDRGPHTEELFDLMEERFSIKDLRETIRELLKEYTMQTRQDEDFILYLDDRVVVHANTRGSAGYCYVTAWLYPKEG